MTATVGRPMPDVKLEDASGSPVALSEYYGSGPLLVVALRYYGCLPCLEFVRRLSSEYERVQGLGGTALAVGTAAGYQAQHLMDDGLGFPAVVDPDSHLYRAVNLARMRWWEVLRPRGARNYWKSFRRGNRQGRITGDAFQLPGVLVVDSSGVLRWLYRGEAIGDYPTMDDTISAVAAARTV